MTKLPEGDEKSKERTGWSRLGLVLLGALISGPLAAGIGWWLALPSPTEIVIQKSATIRHDVDGLSDLVPGLSLTIDGEPAALVYNEVKLWATGGEHLDELRVSYALANAEVPVFFDTEVSTGHFRYNCDREGGELLCVAGPMLPGASHVFSLRVASAEEHMLTPTVATADVRVNDEPTADGNDWEVCSRQSLSCLGALCSSLPAFVLSRRHSRLS